MLASGTTLFNLKGLLRSFSDSSGLHVNFSKSFLVSVNVSKEKSSHLAQTFGCDVGSMPFTYLGLPLGTTKPSILDFSPLVTKIERRLSGISRFLSYQGRLILVNSVFSALPTFYMCYLQLPPTVINQIDRYQKHCLWSGGDINRKGSCLAAWDIACRTKEEGGLGIVNMKSQNVALLIKYLDKFYNHADILWVSLTWSKLYSNNSTPPHARSPIGSFWWKDIMKLMDKFLLMAKCNTSKDNSVLFWHDNWLQDTVKSSFPQLYSFTKKPKCSLRFFVDQSLDRLFHLPLSIQASNQVTDLQAVLQEGVWDREEDDYWVYSWGSSTYNNRKAYKCLQGSYEASPLFSWLWSSGNLGKHQFIFWHLLKDRLNTRNLLWRKNKALDDYSCVICSLKKQASIYSLNAHSAPHVGTT